jgi:hypothetical protein
MTERPILFSGPMVRAILDGRKTQTRRVDKPQPPECVTLCVMDDSCRVKYVAIRKPLPEMVFSDSDWIPCPYGKIGDRLWVRETWISGWPYESGELMQFDEDGNELPKKVWYRADGDLDAWFDDDECRREKIPWRPSIHMPRWASRIMLEITGVRVERLQSISVSDCISEGIDHGATDEELALIDVTGDGDDRHKERFASLWDSINAKRGFGWDTNPWVWVIEFKRAGEVE